MTSTSEPAEYIRAKLADYPKSERLFIDVRLSRADAEAVAALLESRKADR